MCNNFNPGECRSLSAPSNLYSGSCRPGSGGEMNRRSGITTRGSAVSERVVPTRQWQANAVISNSTVTQR